MKGIIHVFEIVIVGMVVFIAVLQFSYIPRMESDWSRTEIIFQGWDMLFTMDEKGVNWLDPNEVRSELDYMLNNTNVKYKIDVRGAPDDNISVGCICSPPEFNNLRNLLTQFNINGENIRFYVSRIDPNDITFSHRFDVIFSWDYDLSDYRSNILNFLEVDKGIVEIKSLTGPGDIDPVQSDVFGLSWGGASPNSRNISFTTQPSNAETYTIEKYFYSIPYSGGSFFTEPHEFTEFFSGERVIQKNNDTKRIALTQENSDVPGCIINYQVSEGFGRTAWIPEGVETLGDDHKVLIKTLVTWAAGRELELVRNDIGTSVAKLSFYKVLDTDMHQPIEIVLEMGYLF